jgi:hypothetical protein
MKRLWFPTEDDVNLSRIVMYIAVPAMLLLSMAITFLIPRVSAIGMNMTIVLLAAMILLRGLVMIRGASTLPVAEDDIEKYKAISKRYRQTCKAIVFILPLASLLLLVFKPDLFLFGLGILAIVSIILLGLSGTAVTVFTCVVLSYSVILLVLTAVQRGLIEALQLVVIAVGIVTPHAFSILMKMRRASENMT